MASLNEFDNLLADFLAPFIALSNQIGDLVQQQAALVNQSFQTQRAFIEMAARSAKPATHAEFMAQLKPISDLIQQIQDIREKNRKHDQFNHLSAISEGIAALGWIAVAPTPAPYVKEMCDSAQFYTNKILVAFKDKPDQAHHPNWARAWITFLQSLQQYIRKHHTTGLVWASVGTAGGCPAPPPPPPPMLNLGSSTGDKAMDDARAALFASINKGTDITKGLRKVDACEMTHKNPALRASGIVPDKDAAKSAATGGMVKGPAPKGPPKLELDGKKWIVENFTGRRDLSIVDTQMTQSISVYRCDDCVLVVKGKINSITVDRCKKFSLVFDSIVSVVEFINSQSVQAQAMEVVPTITVDCVDGIELYLNPKSLIAEIVSSKSTAVNISVPDSKGDYVEHPIPEQFKTTWSGKGFQTVPVPKN